MCSRGLRCGVCLPQLLMSLKRRNPAKVGILSVERILLTVSVLVFQICCSIGSRWSSVSGPVLMLLCMRLR
jgi:hypothetical protein